MTVSAYKPDEWPELPEGPQLAPPGGLQTLPTQMEQQHSGQIIKNTSIIRSHKPHMTCNSGNYDGHARKGQNVRNILMIGFMTLI